MRISTVLMVAAMLAVGAPAGAKDESPQFKTAEARHFTQAEGVELTPAFADYFYAELRSELVKAKLAGDVIGEGETVEDSDAPQSIVITGTIIEYKKGNLAKRMIPYAGTFGAGWRSLKMDADVVRRSDKQNLSTLHVHVKLEPTMDEKIMAKTSAKQLVNEMKKALKEAGK